MFMSILTQIYRWTMALLIMTITGSISLLLVLISFGYLRNFCSQYIIKYSSRIILRLIGFKGIFPDPEALPKHPVLYTFNHNSYLDVFLLTGMGLRNNRMILSENTIKYIPLVISAKAVGTFYIPDKDKHARRLKFFKRVTRFLKRSKCSIMGSSEGVHDYFHGIAPFNRGVYHMAMEANLPIVALYIHIPKENNPMRGGTEASGGTIRIDYLKEFETKHWKLENLEKHIQEVRSVFIEQFNKLNPYEPSN